MSMFFHSGDDEDLDCDWEPQDCPLCAGDGCETCDWSGQATEQQLAEMRHRVVED